MIEHGRVLQAGAVDVVFRRPASLRVAELLGLHNVGEGTMRAPGMIETDAGLVIAAPERAIPAGERVMWRVAPSSLTIAPNGAHAGTIDSAELRHGDLYAVATIIGMRFDIACDVESSDVPKPGPARFAIDPRGVSAWVIGRRGIARETALPSSSPA